MKVALVYTSTTPELIELVEKEVGDVLPRETEVAVTRILPSWQRSGTQVM